MGEERRDLRVLVVEDDETIRLLIAHVLTGASCRVFTATDGVEAVECLETEPVDLLITDYDMPRMNGLELVRWSRARWPHVTTVLITGHDPSAVAPEGWPSGVQHIFRKPFSVEHLLSLVGELRSAGVIA
jgi:two-component system capsular synthesis sensor histidine kinase RcsC